jgi:glycosyltransferase involved in cell wall biosynthesis
MPPEDPAVRTLVAIPVYNEEKYVRRVLAHVLQYADDVLVVDDGSTDRTVAALPQLPVDVIRHHTNLGYGRSLRDAFAWAALRKFDWVITMDCDEQHEPQSIPDFIAAARENTSDIISGSRYLTPPDDDGMGPPPDRRRINSAITEEINARLAPSLGCTLTDAFCGFKAHRVDSLRRLRLSEDGYAFPMQLWAQAAARGLRVREIPVRLIYNDPNRTFGAALDDPTVRLAHYRCVLHAEIDRHARRLPPAASANLYTPCTESRLRTPRA